MPPKKRGASPPKGKGASKVKESEKEETKKVNVSPKKGSVSPKKASPKKAAAKAVKQVQESKKKKKEEEEVLSEALDSGSESELDHSSDYEGDSDSDGKNNNNNNGKNIHHSLSSVPQLSDEKEEDEDGDSLYNSNHQLNYSNLDDQIIWSDNDEEADNEIILFPDADTLRNDEEEEENANKVIKVGTRQVLEETDSSEDEGTLNRVGDIPMEWYKDEEHIGYDIEGKKLMKSERSALERLLEATDDPNAMRTIHDILHDEKKVLSNADLQIIFNLQRNRTTNSEYDMYSDAMVDTVKFDPLNHPLARGGTPSKAKFTPSVHDMKVVAKMVRRMRREDALKKLNKDKPDDEEDEEQKMQIWDDAKVEMDTHTHFKYFNRIPKPKIPPPGTYESYRPPPEYLPSEAAKRKQASLRAIDRKEHFLPQAFDALRHVPFYNHTIQDRYQRCLDLAFFPRAQRTRLVVDPSKLLPELPDPKDLRPYPERLSFQYKGHTATVRSVSASPNGQFVATGCDDHLVRVYETQTGRLMKRYDMGAPVQQVEFCPSRNLNLLVVAVEYSLVLIVPTFAAHVTVNDYTIRFLKAPGYSAGKDGEAHVLGGATLGGHGITQTAIDQDELAHEAVADLHDVEEREKRAEFVDASAKERAAGIVVKIAMHAKIKKFTFHIKGDYLCCLCPKDHVKYRQTVMLQLSKRKVFCPFRKFSEIVTDCKFHPKEPIFFLATTNSVRVYNLMAHRLQKRFKAPGGVTTCLSIHPEGDNFLVGDSTNHTSWYDVDFSEKPYKRMKSHKGIVNQVAYHPNTGAYPLFASAASDGQVHVFHGMVYDDFNKNALIVPVKILKHRRPVYALSWHPTLPWLFSSTDDGIVSLWTE